MLGSDITLSFIKEKGQNKNHSHISQKHEISLFILSKDQFNHKSLHESLFIAIKRQTYNHPKS